MSKNTFYLDSRKLHYLLDERKTFCIRLNTDTGHCRIYLNMYPGCFTKSDSRLRKGFCLIFPEDRRSDLFPDHIFIRIRESIAQDQDRFLHPRMTQDQCFFRCCNCIAPYIWNVFELLCDPDCSMSIAVCLDHRNDFCILCNVFLHAVHIV